MWRDEDFVSVLFRRFEDPLHIFDCIVLRDTLADRSPRKTFIAQNFILWVDENHRTKRNNKMHINKTDTAYLL
jgi:hypothetical protein